MALAASARALTRAGRRVEAIAELAKLRDEMEAARLAEAIGQVFAATAVEVGEDDQALAAARQLAARWGVGIEGEAAAFPDDSPAPLPEAYDEKTARYLLGGISRTTLYAELATGRLKRMAGTRRVLVTRQSIERRCELN